MHRTDFPRRPPFLLLSMPMAMWMGLVLGAAVYSVLPDSCPAQAVVSTRIVGGDPTLTDSMFTVMVEVSANDTRYIPVACAFFVYYPTNSVQFVSVSAADLGYAGVGPEEGTHPTRFRNVATLSNVENSSLTPRCFFITFRTLSAPVSPYTIWVEDNPFSQAPLLDLDIQTAIPHIFNCSATARKAWATLTATGCSNMPTNQPSFRVRTTI